MIKKLRKKFITITISSLMAVITLLIIGINAYNFVQIDRELNKTLNAIAMNDGVFPEDNRHDKDKDSGKDDSKPPKKHSDFSPEAPFETRYFSVVINTQTGGVVSVDTGKIAAISTENASEYALELFEKGRQSGFYHGYKFMSHTSEGLPDATRYTFLDCHRELSHTGSFLLSSIVISAVAVLLVFLLILLMSEKAIRPIAESYEKQKQFITDAGHEIKTPLTIIDAGAEVIEMESGESEWTASIKNQVKRLSALTEKLIFLSRMDEDSNPLTFTVFSLSDITNETAESFFSVAQARGKLIECDIADNINYKGDETAVVQLISILIDNAIKYSDENAVITVKLSEQGKNKELKISNTVDFIEKGKHDELFERFYRKDMSRNSRTGGHGIGLSCAKAIVTAHKGKISAMSHDGKSITFTVIL